MNQFGYVALFLTLLAIVLPSCAKKAVLPAISAADSIAIVQNNLTRRFDADAFFRSDSGSPFRRDSTVGYHGVKWFAVDVRFRGVSMLHKYERLDTVTVLGTKGEERKQLRYGYFEFVIPDEHGAPYTVKMNAYKFTPYDTRRYTLYPNALSVWFTDKTTGKETYDVGRYVDVGDEHSDPLHVYTIDLNKAYNPYCAYSNLYSCAVPRKEDHLNIAIRVGEKKYHE